MKPPPGRHLAVVGPTASGKSALALELAERLGRQRPGQQTRGVELLSADSMAVYRGMDIGTTTPTAAQRSRVAHHLIDLVDPDEEFSVGQYRREADAILRRIEADGAHAILVGGTGLYVNAVVDALELPGRYPEVRAELEREADPVVLHERLRSLDPAAAERIEPSNRRRTIRALEVTLGSGRPFSDYGPGVGAQPPTPFVMVGIDVPREDLEPRIRARLARQLEEGWLDEVRALRDDPRGWSRTAAQALGYAELSAHLAGGCTLDEAVAAIVRRTRQFAVRQLRWFGRDDRITWFEAGSAELADRVADHWICSSSTVTSPPS